jgi:hypothetical protein
MKPGMKIRTFPPARVALGSGTGFPVLCGKGKKKSEFPLFSVALGPVAFLRACFSSRSRAPFFASR